MITGIYELMRTVDAYAFDYGTQGKMAPSRRAVELELQNALPGTSHDDTMTQILGIIMQSQSRDEAAAKVREMVERRKTELKVETSALLARARGDA